MESHTTDNEWDAEERTAALIRLLLLLDLAATVSGLVVLVSVLLVLLVRSS
jgi:hypothetical protein